MKGTGSKKFFKIIILFVFCVVLAIPLFQLYLVLYGSGEGDLPGTAPRSIDGGQSAAADPAHYEPKENPAVNMDIKEDEIPGSIKYETGGAKADNSLITDAAANKINTDERMLILAAGGLTAEENYISPVKIINNQSLSISELIAARIALFPGSPVSMLSLAAAFGAPGAYAQPGQYTPPLTGTICGINQILKDNIDLHSLIVQKDDRPKKPVYLTIDDGPSSLTRQYLDILKENDVRATFFVIGRNARRYPDYIREIYDGGHCLANHSYSHNYDKIYKSASALTSELKQWDKAIGDILGFEYHSSIFRFPGGSSYKSAVKYRNAVNKLGYIYYDWNCLNGDAQIKDKSVENLYKYMVSTFKEQDEVIFLMHDTDFKQTSVDMLEDAIKFFKKNGYEFHTLNEKIDVE